MSDEGTVSTGETPPARNAITVMTEEPGKPEPDESRASSGDDTENQSQTPDDSATSETKDDTSNADKRERRRSRNLQRKLTKTLARNEELAQQNEDFRRRLEALEKRATTPAPEKPKLSDYEDEDKFAAAYAAWQAATEPAPAAPATPAPPDTQSEPQDDPYADDRAALMKQGEERFGDEFAEVMQQTGDQAVPISQTMADIIFDSDVGADLVMWADEHRDKALEMYLMGPVKAAREFGKVEAELKKARGAEKPKDPPKDEPKDRKVSQAPEPPSQGVSTGESPPDTGIREGLTMDEYAQRRRAQAKAAGRPL